MSAVFEGDDAPTIDIESGISRRTRRGFVTLTWGRMVTQLTPSEARMHALRILEVAEAADSDAAVFELLTKTVELQDNVAQAFVVDLRKHRDHVKAQARGEATS
jgi:hypothetical protein